jgi:hypothetical protein
VNLQIKIVSKLTWHANTNSFNWGTQVALGDFNFDGIVDFAVNINDNDEKTSDLRIFAATATSQFEDITSRLNINIPTYQTSNFLTADANNDGFTYIFIGRSAGDGDTKDGVYPDSQLIYLSDGRGAYRSITSEKLIYAHNVMIADVNGDNLVDAFFFATGIGPSILAINKFDEANDFLFTSSGLPDKAFYGGGRGENSWDFIEIRSDGSPTIIKGFHQHNTAFNDVNRDGKLDMVMFFAGSKEGRIYFNRGGENPLFVSNDFVEFNSVITGFPSAGHFYYPIYAQGEKWGENTKMKSIKQGMNYYESIQFDVDGDGWQDVIAVGTYEHEERIIGGSYLNGSDGFNNGTLYQVLINQNNQLADQTDLRIKQPKVNFNTDYHYGHYTMLSAVDLNGDGHLDFTSNMSSGSPIGTPTAAGDSATIFMLNDGHGKFSETTIEGLEYGSFNPIVVNGKLGFLHVTVAGYDWQTRVNRTETEGTIIQTTVPWTVGGDGRDHLYGTPANDHIVGGDGLDIFHPNGRRSDFTVSSKTGQFFLREKSGLSGIDSLDGVERISFNEISLALDLNGNAGTTAKILGAVFGKESLSNKNYFGIGLHFLDAGWSYDNLADVALDAAGAKTNDQIVSLLWSNVIGTTPTAADKQPFVALLENGMTAGALARLAADTTFNTTNINLVGLAQTGIEYIPVG